MRSAAASAEHGKASHDYIDPAEWTDHNGRHSPCAGASQEHGMGGLGGPRCYDYGEGVVPARRFTV